MRSIDTEISIDASPLAVWDLLVDFDRYHEWNPFIPRGAGRPEIGATLVLEMQPPGDKLRTMRPTVLVATPGEHLRWRGTLSIPGLFTGRHEFILEPLGAAGTRVRHREDFTGLLVPFLGGTLKKTEQGFHALNEALKKRAEGPGRR
jgi:hypothetical protein